jgi:hypothetical protein
MSSLAEGRVAPRHRTATAPRSIIFSRPISVQQKPPSHYTNSEPQAFGFFGSWNRGWR